jgi:hypothetical protein
MVLAQTALAIVVALGIIVAKLVEALLILALMLEVTLAIAALVLALILEVALAILALVLAFMLTAKLVEALPTVVLTPAMLVLIVEVAAFKLAKVSRLPPLPKTASLNSRLPE